MIFLAFSSSARESLEIFVEHYQHSADDQDQLFFEKIERCAFQVLLVAGDEPVLGDIHLVGIDEKTLLALSDSWRSICGTTSRQRAVQKKSWQVIDGIGERIPFHMLSVSQYVRRFYQFNDEEILFILLKGDEPHGLPVNELALLSDHWQLKQGFFALHASGVQHKGNLYLFSGPSGAGKSTVATLSLARGDRVIDQDKVLVHPRTGGGYSADGWGYGIVPCEVPLRAIFRLVQDAEERLIPLNQVKVGRLILERHNDVMGGLLAEDLVRQSFHLASEIARQVPGFELHFCKSPDFWKLIDAQFPD
jgi:hypothetical protein